jgi:hypothetical protein
MIMPRLEMSRDFVKSGCSKFQGVSIMDSPFIADNMIFCITVAVTFTLTFATLHPNFSLMTLYRCRLE